MKKLLAAIGVMAGLLALVQAVPAGASSIARMRIRVSAHETWWFPTPPSPGQIAEAVFIEGSVTVRNPTDHPIIWSRCTISPHAGGNTGAHWATTHISLPPGASKTVTKYGGVVYDTPKRPFTSPVQVTYTAVCHWSSRSQVYTPTNAVSGTEELHPQLSLPAGVQASQTVTLTGTGFAPNKAVYPDTNNYGEGIDKYAVADASGNFTAQIAAPSQAGRWTVRAMQDFHVYFKHTTWMSGYDDTWPHVETLAGVAGIESLSSNAFSYNTYPNVGWTAGWAAGGTFSGTTVTVTGYFPGATSVAVNGTNVTFTQVSDTQITFNVPVGMTTSSGPVTVTTPYGTYTSPKNLYIHVVEAVPTITQVVPDYLSGTYWNYITGTNLGSATSVSFTADYSYCSFTRPGPWFGMQNLGFGPGVFPEDDSMAFKPGRTYPTVYTGTLTVSTLYGQAVEQNIDAYC